MIKIGALWKAFGYDDKSSKYLYATKEHQIG